MTEIMQRATELAEKNTPGVALTSVRDLAENLFLGIFACLAWVLGRSWFHGSQLLYAAGLAFADGYRRGAKAPRVPQQPPVPRQEQQRWQPDVVTDTSIRDAYSTPFGVPH
jgi:hypothetical protein